MNNEIDEMYNDLIMEHSMNSYNKKKLEHADFCESRHCVDFVEVNSL